MDKKYIELTDKTGFSNNTREKFLKELSSRHPASQVEQADKAIAIYHSFLRINYESNTKNTNKEKIVLKIVRVSNCPRPLKENILTPAKDGQGSGSFHP